MTKQEFMAMSLPYGLHAEILDYKCDYVGNQYDLIIGILQWSKDGDLWCLQTKGGARPSFDRVKPILHPISDLTKEVEHKGKKFVPIVELVKTFEKIHGTPKTKQGKDISGCLFTDSDGSLTVFAYHWKTQSFGSNYYRTPEFINVHYQFPMFKKLIEWHFDISGLIEKGEAIDVNSLEINPYK